MMDTINDVRIPESLYRIGNTNVDVPTFMILNRKNTIVLEIDITV